MSDHEPPVQNLTTGAPPTVGPVGGGMPVLRGVGVPIDESGELVADLLAATKLVPEDKLALARGRARTSGSFAAALVAEGIASSEGIARILAARHNLPLVDLQLTGVDERAARLVPLHVLERTVAIPYQQEGELLRVAVADPANLHGIDELRLAIRGPIELGGASREEITIAIKKLVRASEAFGARSAVEDEMAAEVEEDTTDLEAEDGVSDV